jgi:hypothetical protein
MTVYVDDLRTWGGKQWCHLVGTNEGELDYFATSRLDLRAKWRQDTGGYLHYDLTPAKRKLALRRGAKYLPTKELLKRVERRKT